MKRLLLFLLSAPLFSIAQNNVGIGTAIPNASALLELSSTSKGILIPRMTQAQRAAIANPAQGLLVYQTDGTTGFYVNRSSIPAIPNWSAVSEGASLWTTNIITPSQMYNLNSGNIGIGNSSPTLGGLVVDTKAGAVNAIFGSSDTGVAIESNYPGIALNSYYNSGRKSISNGYGALVGLNPTNGDFYIQTSSTAGTTGNAISLNNRIHINSSGKVGIGTVGSGSMLTIKPSSGTADLELDAQVAGGDNAVMRLNKNGTSNYSVVRFNNLGSNVWDLGMQGDDNMKIKLTGNTAFEIDKNTRHVALGTNDFTEYFTSLGSIKAFDGIITDGPNAGFQFRDRSDNGYGGWNWYASGGTAKLYRYTSGGDLLAITNNGNVGIGTITPGNKLTVKGDGMNISQESADGTVKIGFYTSGTGAFLQTHTNHPLNFTTNNSTAQMTLNTNGNFGIGTTSTPARLTVSTGGTITGMDVYQTSTGVGGYFSTTGNIAVYGTTSSASPAGYFQGTNALTAIGRVGIGTSTPAQNLDIKNGRMRFSGQQSGGNAHGIEFTNNAGTAARSFLGVYDDNTLGFYGFAGAGWSFLYDAVDGSLRIGTTQKATGYLVNVGGKIIAEEVRVQLRASWPDYVFKNDYKLMPLDEVDQFIKKNNHLPGMIPAAVVEKQGSDLGETQRKLLEKVEELTLHMISLNKRVQELEKENNSLKNK